MKHLVHALALAVFCGSALAQPDLRNLPPHPSERWFSLARTTNGYLAAGNLSGTFWAFHVPGDTLKNFDSEATFSVNGVVLQVKAVNRSVVRTDGGNLLIAHRKFEQDHLAQASRGVVFGKHDFCRNAQLPHQQWTARSASGITQAFVTFEVGDYVLMVVAPYEDEKRREAVAMTMDAVCRSFKRQKDS